MVPGLVWRLSSAGLSIDPQGPATGSYRVARGHGWADLGLGCRSAYRLHINPDFRDILRIGFRIVLAPGQP